MRITIPPTTKKPVSAMSRRERIQQMAPELKYALDLIVRRFKFMHEQLQESFKMETANIYIGLTTGPDQRQTLSRFLYGEAKCGFIVIAAGRIGKFDQEPEMPVWVATDWMQWIRFKEEFEVLFECLTLLLDAHLYCQTKRGSHAPYCRHLPISNDIGELRKSLAHVTGTYSKIRINEDAANA